jgi:hypothetical protein
MIATVRSAGEFALRIEPATHLIEKKEDIL